MPIQLPSLDDRTFDDFVEEGKRLIPALAPTWTDHNSSDPGITFIELFAFITEMLIYRTDRVSEANKRAFVKLLRGPAWTPQKNIDEEIRDAVRWLRVEERAITTLDFERLAQAVPGVVRAHCLPRRNLDDEAADKATRDAPAHVSVLIIPPEFLDAVHRELAPRCLLTTRLHVASPRYRRVEVRIKAYVFADQFEESMVERIKVRLETWFDPVTGGGDGRGWPFGQAVYVSAVFAVLDAVEGVDYLEGGTDMLATDVRDREINENGVVIGVRLEPDELVDFAVDQSVVVVERQAALIPEG